MLKKLVAASSVVSIVLLGVLLYTTTPTDIGPLGIFILFVLAYVSVLGVLTYLLFIFSKIISKLASFVTARQPLHALSFRRSYYFSSILTLVPIMLIGLQSVGEVGLYEAFLVAFFAFIGCLYVAKRTS